jgi:hypothetical protein
MCASEKMRFLHKELYTMTLMATVLVQFDRLIHAWLRDRVKTRVFTQSLEPGDQKQTLPSPAVSTAFNLNVSNG